MSPPLQWVREQIDGWEQSTVGLFRGRGANEQWPLSADGPVDLKERLLEHGHLLPLPTEPAALANLLEIELREHLVAAAETEPGVTIRLGTQRSYPDIEITGPAFGDRYHAADIKCARRSRSGKSLQSSIALYAGNTYFLWPQLKFSGILRPYGDYASHLAIVVVYDFHPDRPERISNLHLISVRRIEDLIKGHGEFDSQEAFETYWRASARNWKKSPEAEKLLRRALEGD